MSLDYNSIIKNWARHRAWLVLVRPQIHPSWDIIVFTPPTSATVERETERLRGERELHQRNRAFGFLCFWYSSAMETLASQLTSTLRLPSMVSVSFNGRLSSSIVLTKPSLRVHAFRCSALSSPSLGKLLIFFRFLLKSSNSLSSEPSTLLFSGSGSVCRKMILRERQIASVWRPRKARKLT